MKMDMCPRNLKKKHIGCYIPQSLGELDPVDLVELDTLLSHSVQESELGSVAYVP